VDLDIIQNAEPGAVATVGGYHTIPTYTSGLNQLQDKLTAFLDKLQALPLDETVKTANGALAEIKDVATRLSSSSASLDTLLAAKETQQLPAELKSSLDSLQATLDGFNEKSDIYRDLATVIQELSSALRSIDALASTVERKPSSLIWGNPKGTVKPPKAKR
jgi:paraquat-inducible protein B